MTAKTRDEQGLEPAPITRRTALKTTVAGTIASVVPPTFATSLVDPQPDAHQGFNKTI